MTFPGKRQLQVLQAIINKALVLDPQAQQQLKRLTGKRFRIECTEPAADLLIQIDENAIILEQPDGQAVTSHLSGDMTAFIKLLSADDKAAALINADMRLQGDSQLLIELQEILSNMDLDWEYHLARVIGDLPAHLIGQAGRNSFHWLKQSQPVFMRHLKEYILEEAKLSPTKSELDHFISDIQNLDERIDRIQAKLIRIKNRSSHTPSPLSSKKQD